MDLVALVDIIIAHYRTHDPERLVKLEQKASTRDRLGDALWRAAMFPRHCHPSLEYDLINHFLCDVLPRNDCGYRVDGLAPGGQPMDLRPLLKRPAKWNLDCGTLQIGAVSYSAVEICPLDSSSTARETSASSHEPVIKLRPASDKMICDTISAVYDDAAQAKTKPPNIKQIAAPVLERLVAQGKETSKQYIRELATKEPFSSRRQPSGVRFRK